MKRLSAPAIVLTAILLIGATGAWAGPPAQKLPSALIVLPLIESNRVTRETRIELVNLSNQNIDLECFYVYDDSCNEIGFFMSLSPWQPVSWLASGGFSVVSTYSRVPPFFGQGALQCAVLPQLPQVQYHNVLQGRAIIYGTDGRTVAYSASAFRRLSDGDFTGVLSLDGVTYEQCPDKLHFTMLAETAGVSDSEMVLIPCTQDLLHQVPTRPNVQLVITNEFEQSFSASIRFECFYRHRLNEISTAFNRSTLGTDTAHVTVRGSSFPLIGLAIDRFDSNTKSAGNDPSFEGGRTATVTLP